MSEQQIKKRVGIQLISGGDSDADNDEGTLTINEDFAQRYDRWRSKEELQKFKDRYGDDVLEQKSDSSSSSETEDENAEYLSEQLEKGFFKTLSLIRAKDSRIYDKDATFYIKDSPTTTGGSRAGHSSKQLRQQRPLYLRDYDRKVMLERGGKYEEEEVGGSAVGGAAAPQSVKSYYEEQADIKRSFKHALEEEESDDEGLLVKKVKSEEEKKIEETEYIQWLKGTGAGHLAEEDKDDLRYLHDLWQDEVELEPGEKFLKDFLLNKRYLEDDGREQSSGRGSETGAADWSEDEQEIYKQEDFERKYNFRFEEPDHDFIKSYPRTLQQSVRSKDERRKNKRAEIKQRKEEERRGRQEELKQLKNARHREMAERLAHVRRVAGCHDDKLHAPVNITTRDLEQDFDPDRHDTMMAETFGSQYYNESGEVVEDMTKPEFSDMSDIDEDWDEWRGERSQEVTTGQQGDGEESQPCYSTTHNTHEATTSTSHLPDLQLGKGTKKRRSAFAQAVYKQKPVFDPGVWPSFAAYCDEYYSLDYEDLIAGGSLPTRFRYRRVTPNAFGLSAQEVLAADDRELNQWVSLRRCSQYRSEAEEKYDVQAYVKKGSNVGKKRRIFASLYPTAAPAADTTAADTDTPRGDITDTSKSNPHAAKVKKKKTQKMDSSSKTASLPEAADNNTDAVGDVSVDCGHDSNIAVNKLSEQLAKISEGRMKKRKSIDSDKSERLKKTKKQEETTETIQQRKSKATRQLLNGEELVDKKKKVKHIKKMKEDNGLVKTKLQKQTLVEKPTVKKKKKIKKGDVGVMSDARYRAYGLNPKKFNKKLKHQRPTSSSNTESV